ncbi:unnamed protein product [Prorocentrum cordatum]|uniref:Uncharacterized protein n=1 Tax=Prorocentrum cordatum TaxID=2364126 RepID=A0ABN9TJW7_9DINO|nr:unnamed protein product [Polarella glacialis]
MNEVREVSTSDIKNSEKVHMGDRSPPRRALGAAGEGEDREDSPGQGADSPPLGNLPPREQTRGRAEGRGAREEQEAWKRAPAPTQGVAATRGRRPRFWCRWSSFGHPGREGRAMEANCCSPPRPMAAASTRRAFAPLLARLNNDARAVQLRLKSPSRGCSGAGRGSGTDTIGPVGGRGGRRSEKGRKRPGPACPCRWR